MSNNARRLNSYLDSLERKRRKDEDDYVDDDEQQPPAV